MLIVQIQSIPKSSNNSSLEIGYILTAQGNENWLLPRVTNISLYLCVHIQTVNSFPFTRFEKYLIPKGVNHFKILGHHWSTRMHEFDSSFAYRTSCGMFFCHLQQKTDRVDPSLDSANQCDVFLGFANLRSTFGSVLAEGD
jgi:hypothetical protein